MRTMMKLDRDEIHKVIPFALICETRYGRTWNTMKRKRLWAEQFTESEKEAASRLFKKAHEWTLVKGVPETVTMSPDTLTLWMKLGNFCASL